MAGSVEALVFDLDGTVCEYCRSVEDLLDHSFEAVGVDPFFSAEAYYSAFDEYVEGADEVEEIRERAFAGLASEAGVDPAVGRAVAAAYADARDHTNVRFLTGAQAALETLTEQYPTAAVTNGDPAMQSQKMAGLGIEDRFETVVYAGYDTPAKPDPEPFESALDALGVASERAVKIGNSLDHDVRGAHNAGLHSVWLDRNGVDDPVPEPHYRIESMRELLAEPWSVD